jgi:hypothetical protein
LLTLRGFEVYRDYHLGGERANGGTAILAPDCVYTVSVPLHNILQAIAVRITLGALSIIICNIYLQPIFPIPDADLVRFISQLPTPIVLLGAF